MKRKIFSKLLMGALLVASVSSFTSCKDYDDDINSLRNDVEKRALQSELTALQTTVAGVQSTASDALAKATAAATATDLNSVKTELATVKANADKAATAAAQGIKDAASAKEAAEVAQKAAEKAAADATAALKEYVKTADMEAALKEYVTATAFKEAVDGFKAQFDEFVNTNNGSLEEMKAEIQKFKDTYAQIWSAVTNVSIVGTNGSDGAFNNITFLTKKIDNTDVGFTRYDSENAKSKKDGVFGEKDMLLDKEAYNADKKTFTNGGYVKFPSSIVVRVSPANAQLNVEDVKLINSLGAEITDYVQVESVAPYDKIITRDANTSGLWYVYLTAKDGATSKNITDATTTNNGTSPSKKIAYAVAVNNTVSADETRYAISEYAVTFNGTTPYKGPREEILDAEIKSAVSNKAAKLSTIKNRRPGQPTGTTYFEKKWNGNANATTLAPINDNRTGGSCKVLAVNNGEEITIDLSKAVSKNRGETVKYFYVTLDTLQAVSVATGADAASEINAWMSYKYIGLNTTIDYEESTTVTFSCTIPGVVGDEVAFRLYAVNYDGTLADPDGVGFVVYVGGNAAAATASGIIKPVKGASGAVTVVAPITGSLQAGTKDFALNGTNAANNDWTLDVNGDNDYATIGKAAAGTVALTTEFTVVLNGLYSDLKADGTGKTAVAAAKYDKAKYIQFTITPATGYTWANWTDDGKQKMTFIAKNDKGVLENTLAVDLTKVLPTAADAPTWSWKDNQKVNGVYTAYMYPESGLVACDDKWTTAFSTTTRAYKAMNNVFNGLSTTTTTGGTTTYSSVDGFEFIYGNTVKDADGNYTEPLVVTQVMKNSGKNAFYVLELLSAQITDLMDGTTQHDTKLGYNFGAISSVADKNVDYTGGAGTGYTVDLDTYKTVYDCPLNTTVQKYEIAQPTLAVWTESTLDPVNGVWKEGAKSDINYIIYNKTKVATDKNFYDVVKAAGTAKLSDRTFFETTANSSGVLLEDYILATNSYDNSAKADGGFKGSLKEILGAYYASYSFSIVSNNSTDLDYYTVTSDGTNFTFTRTPSTASVPLGGDVNSKFNMNLTDAFGHTHKYAFDFIVKKP